MRSESQRLELRRRRGGMAGAAVLITLSLLAVAFFRLQILSGNQYALQSEENRLRAISLPAPRGTIYDRNGRVVAENVPGYVVSILPGPRDTVAATLERLADRLELSLERREDLLGRNRARPNESLVVHDDASFEQVAFIEARRPRFRRVVVEAQPQRRYPNGPPVAHIIGYVSEINERELALPRYEGYEAGRTIGKDGLEAQYEALLAGDRGVRYVEVNALGSIVREFDVGSGQPAIPGNDLQLGLDLDLQVYADSIFPEGMRGGVVALDPHTGEVVLAYSHPTFDPNRFIGGIPGDLWNALRDDPDKPMLNRVSTAAYPPGSTWKLVMSAIGMKRGHLAIDTYLQHTCRGGLSYGNRFFRCWNSAGHGGLDLSGAIKNSCNVYFYQTGQRIGLDPMLEDVQALGFGQRTGIDLPFEIAGIFPPSREWFNEQYGRRGWTESVVWNLSIGQGENQQSLLGMAQFYAALATGQSPIRPHFARDENLAGRRVDWRLDLSEARRYELVDALARVVNEPGGTAYSQRLDRWTLAGKTGTAQNPHGAPHSWFVGFAPAYDPRVVVAAVVEQGHPDGQPSLAVPLASRVVDRFLESIAAPIEERPGARPVVPPPADVVVSSPSVGSP
ncbi:MAG: penicillin-binding protein 2 [Gemmatimonadetes bacterium]|nr:penicillin-binding protein 2 [Gemmatimonadota bacterium]